METEIRYLRTLELDLARAAAWATDGLEPGEGRGGRRRGRRVVSGGGRRRRRWPVFTAAAAAFVVLAFVVGFFSQGGGDSPFRRLAGAPAPQFTQVGEAVNGAGGGAAGPSPARLGPNTHSAYLNYTVNADGSLGLSIGAPGDSSTTSPGGSVQDLTGVDLTKTDLSKIVRDGTISLQIPDGTFDDRFQQVQDVAAAAGGMVLSSSTEGEGSGTLTLRIPAAHFEQAFEAIRKLGTPLASSSKGQDVTAAYLDLQAHLKILKARRAFLFGLWAKITTVSQSIDLHNRLEDVQLAIDKIQGQTRFLDDQVALSTLKVDLREKSTPAQQQAAADVNNPSLGHAWSLGIQGFLNVIATVVIGLGYLVPIAVLAALVLLVVRLVRRRRPEAS